MEREYPTLEELERARAELTELVRDCERSGACPFGWADAWQLEHVTLDELGCPGWCSALSSAEHLLWQGPARPASDEIPF